MKRDLVLKMLVGLGAGVFIIGLFVAPERIWPNYLIAVLYLTYLGLAGVFFIASQYLTKAGWAVAFRRVPESMTSSLVWAGILMLMIAFGIHNLYEWSHEAIRNDKSCWLNPPFFLVRSVLYFALWIVIGRLLIRNSRRQDEDGNLNHTFANIKLSAVFAAVFAVTVPMSSWDWLMSLEPHWYSTIFGAYVFAGCFQSGIAAIIILLIILRRGGAFHENGRDLVTEHHYHDLGKLLFAFSCFWAYLWFCQYMLIWYANLPEETGYFIRRKTEGWNAFFFINLLLNWIVPFFAIMSASAKRSEQRLLLVAMAVALGRWFDLYTMVMPVFSDTPVIAIWEVAPLLGIWALFILSSLQSFKNAKPVPVNDPLLSESLHHHV